MPNTIVTMNFNVFMFPEIGDDSVFPNVSKNLLYLKV